MAYDLRAVLRLEDRFTNPARQIARQTELANRATQRWVDSNNRLRDGLGRFATSANRHNTSISKISSSIGGAIRGVGSLTSGLYGLAGAYAAVRGAEKVFKATVGEAAKYEQSSIIIGAMLNDKELGKQYMELVDRFSIDSPILDSQGMLGNSKSFLTASKDMKQLEKMWSLAERMAAIDPYQGLEGAVFALRELFSGDAISMVRRFEMPKKVMNDIKNLELDQQLFELDKYFNSIGMTQHLIDEMGGTTLGVLAQIKEASNVILRTMGAPALEKVKSFLNEVKTGMVSVKDVIANRNFFTPEEFKKNLDRAMMFERFQDTGAKIIDNITTGLLNGVSAVGRWVEALTNNPEFQRLQSIQAKVGFVFNNIWDAFTAWANGPGKPQIQDTTKDLIELMAMGLRASEQIIVDTALIIGEAIGSAMASKASDAFAGWADKAIQNSKLFNIPALKPLKWAHQAGSKLRDAVWGNSSSSSSSTKKAAATPSSSIVGGKFGKSYAGGLERVPYDRYPATLHKGEQVLTAEEARAYRNGSSGGGFTIAKLADQIIVREDADIDRIGQELLRRLQQAQLAGA